VDADLFNRLVTGASPPEIFVAHATTGPTSVLVRANIFSLEAARRQSTKRPKFPPMTAGGDRWNEPGSATAARFE
jgi:hypothetical protein